MYTFTCVTLTIKLHRYVYVHMTTHYPTHTYTTQYPVHNHSTISDHIRYQDAQVMKGMELVAMTIYWLLVTEKQGGVPKNSMRNAILLNCFPSRLEL